MTEAPNKTTRTEKASMVIRVFNIGIRTAHIAVAGILVGGHIFAMPPSRLYPWLYLTMITGGALVIAEAYPHWRWWREVCGCMVIAKVAFMSLVHWEWEYRVVLLLSVIIIGSIGAHMPKDIRHYRILPFRKGADP